MAEFVKNLPKRIGNKILKNNQQEKRKSHHTTLSFKGEEIGLRNHNSSWIVSLPLVVLFSNHMIIVAIFLLG